jgi:hypothetical protein
MPIPCFCEHDTAEKPCTCGAAEHALAGEWETELMPVEPAEPNPHYFCSTIHSPACPTGEHPPLKQCQGCTNVLLLSDPDLCQWCDEHKDKTDCPGHESTAGPIGNVTYCDGSCQLTDDQYRSIEMRGLYGGSNF